MRKLSKNSVTNIKKCIWLASCIVVIMIILLPVFWMCSVAIRGSREIFTIPPHWIPEKITLVAFKKILNDPGFVRAFINSVFVSLSVTLISVFLSGIAGYGFSRFKFRGKNTFIVYMLSTQMIPPVLLVIPYYLILRKTGLYDTYAGLIMTYLTFTLPFCALILRGFFANIPMELDEAALIDGCSRVGAFFRIILPVSLPGVIAAALFTFLTAWNQFLFALVFTSSANRRMLTVVIGAKLGQYNIFWNDLMAINVIVCFPLIIGFFLLQKYFVRGLTAGAVKI